MSTGKARLIEALVNKAKSEFLLNQYLEICDIMDRAKNEEHIKAELSKYSLRDQKLITGTAADQFVNYRYNLLKEFKKAHPSIFDNKQPLTLSEGGVKV